MTNKILKIEEVERKIGNLPYIGYRIQTEQNEIMLLVVDEEIVTKGFLWAYIL